MPFIADKRYDLLPETRAFLRDWLDWVERGAPQNAPYPRWGGLCFCLWEFPGAKSSTKDDIEEDLERVFACSLVSAYPFGEDAFLDRWHDDTQHLDPNRLAFVRANLPET